MKKRHLNITLTDDEKEKAKRISLKLFGKPNMSGLFAYWINKHYIKN